MQNVYKSGKGDFLIFSCLTCHNEYFSNPLTMKSQSKPLGSKESTAVDM